MGRFGSESRLSSGKSTGTRCFASAANSSAGSCERMTLRDRVEFTGVEDCKVDIGFPLREVGFPLAAKTVAHTIWGKVGAIVLTLRDPSDRCLFGIAHKGPEIWNFHPFFC